MKPLPTDYVYENDTGVNVPGYADEYIADNYKTADEQEDAAQFKRDMEIKKRLAGKGSGANTPSQTAVAPKQGPVTVNPPAFTKGVTKSTDSTNGTVDLGQLPPKADLSISNPTPKKGSGPAQFEVSKSSTLPDGSEQYKDEIMSRAGDNFNGSRRPDGSAKPATPYSPYKENLAHGTLEFASGTPAANYNFSNSKLIDPKIAGSLLSAGYRPARFIRSIYGEYSVWPVLVNSDGKYAYVAPYWGKDNKIHYKAYTATDYYDASSKLDKALTSLEKVKPAAKTGTKTAGYGSPQSQKPGSYTGTDGYAVYGDNIGGISPGGMPDSASDISNIGSTDGAIAGGDGTPTGAVMSATDYAYQNEVLRFLHDMYAPEREHYNKVIDRLEKQIAELQEQEKARKQDVTDTGDSTSDKAMNDAVSAMQDAFNKLKYPDIAKQDDFLSGRNFRDTLNLSRLADSLNNRLYYRPGTASVSKGMQGSELGQRGEAYKLGQVNTEEQRNMELRRRLEQQRKNTEQQLQARWQNIPTDVLEQSYKDAQSMAKEFGISDVNFERQMKGLYDSNVLYQIFNNFSNAASHLREKGAAAMFKARIAELIPNIAVNNEVMAQVLMDGLGMDGVLREDVLNEAACKKILDSIKAEGGSPREQYVKYGEAVTVLGVLANLSRMSAGIGGMRSGFENGWKASGLSKEQFNKYFNDNMGVDPATFGFGTEGNE